MVPCIFGHLLCIHRPANLLLEHGSSNFFTLGEREALALGVRYQGVCCGAGPHHIQAMAEALGKYPPASRYTADMSKHYALGNDPRLVKENMDFAKKNVRAENHTRFTSV